MHVDKFIETYLRLKRCRNQMYHSGDASLVTGK